MIALSGSPACIITKYTAVEYNKDRQEIKWPLFSPSLSSQNYRRKDHTGFLGGEDVVFNSVIDT